MDDSLNKFQKAAPALTLDEALEFNPVGFFQYRILIMCGFAFMADALEVNLLVYLSTCAGDEWGLTNAQQASITGVVFAGILLGSLFWGIFADRYGRKTAFVSSCMFITLGGFLSGAAPEYYSLLVFRTVCGFGIGGSSIPFDLLAEFLPSSHRGTFLVYIEFFWTFGSLFVNGLAWVSLGPMGWRFLAYMTVIPVTMTNLFSIFYLPESPRWLLMKGRQADAEKIVRDAALVNGITMAPFTLKLDEPTSAEEKIVDADYIDLIKRPEIRKVTIPLWIVWIVFGFTYYGLILLVGRVNAVSDDSNDDAPKTCSFDYSGVFINATAEIAGVIITAMCIDKVGRINSQKLFYALSGLFVLFMGFGLPLAGVTTVSWLGRMAIMAASNCTWVSTPELFTTETRTVGHSSSAAWSKVGAFISPYVVVSNLSILSLGIILCIVNLIGAIASHWLPETSGKFLEHPDRDVSTVDGSRVSELFAHHTPSVESWTKSGLHSHSDNTTSGEDNL